MSDITYQRPTFTLQGVTFELKKTSPGNLSELQDFVDDIDVGASGDEQAVAKQHMGILRRIANPIEGGSFDDIDEMDLDVNAVGHYMSVFMGGPNAI